MSEPRQLTDAYWRNEMYGTWLSEATSKHESKEIEPGIWQHTFTPERTVRLDDLIRTEPPTDAKHPSIAGLDAMLESMFARGRANPDMLYVSPGMLRAIRHAQRIGSLYRTLPVPHRKIRKCHLRKLQARWRAGKAHIRRIEAAERAREEDEMRRLRGQT